MLHTGMTSRDLHLQNDKDSKIHFLRSSSSHPSRLWQAILRLGFFLRGQGIHHPRCATCTLSIQLLMQLLFSHPCLDLSFLLMIPKKAGRTKPWKTPPDQTLLQWKSRRSQEQGPAGQAEQCAVKTLEMQKDHPKICLCSASLLHSTRWEPSRAAAWKLWQKMRAAGKRHWENNENHKAQR